MAISRLVGVVIILRSISASIAEGVTVTTVAKVNVRIAAQMTNERLERFGLKLNVPDGFAAIGQLPPKLGGGWLIAR